MPKQYKSGALAAAHEAAQGLADPGVMAKRTMRAFDEMCLTPIEDMPPEKIRPLRLRENASQPVFARHLNVTAGPVSQWEPGKKRTRGPSLKPLTLVEKNRLGAVACGWVSVLIKKFDRPLTRHPLFVMAGLVPAIHVFARSATKLAE